ncbi:hypothetical protein AYL99_11719 [Fonsecaea erecta]|uniref:Uncharacterized protein n=1 Tax=Fonsecaea erecta TaxID=1367422 RepID=A0A178Z3A7_9EURO|nr:hypothetical protein AYL99_11719 [Fonsecaea erecta]OAP54184.1 hypothetical protein AYL99_11719 [Fonsecaea erecta]
MLFAGGPATESPSMVVALELREPIRSPHDIDGTARKKRNDGAPGHKRSVSGNLLSCLSFLSTNGDQDKTDGGDRDGPDSPHRGRGAMAEAQALGKIKRKGYTTAPGICCWGS